MRDDFASWIGKSQIRDDVVTPRILAEYRATLAPHLFQPSSADECPPGLHWCLAVAAHTSGDLGPDGAEAKGKFLPPIPLRRRMWAGGRVETLRPLHLNEQIQRLSTISDVKMRDGKAGALCIVSVTHEISANGEPAIRERHDILFREASGAVVQQKTADPLPAYDLEWQIEAAPLLLFRFSAMTFNSHRIHYDLPYATGVEGYGGLLVHGPLQAALALNQLSVLAGTVPRVFDYRCTAPLIAGQSFRVLSKKQADAGVTSGIFDAHDINTVEAKGS